MNKETENSSEKPLEVIAEQNQVSICSVNFTEVIHHIEEKTDVLPETDYSAKVAGRNALSGKIFKWRNAIAVAAILAVGILHFAFQLSFQREVAKKREAIESPAVSAPVAGESAVSPPARLETKKIENAPARKSPSSVKPRQNEIAPARLPIRKKVLIETRAARLRRAERILTGI